MVEQANHFPDRQVRARPAGDRQVGGRPDPVPKAVEKTLLTPGLRWQIPALALGGGRQSAPRFSTQMLMQGGCYRPDAVHGLSSPHLPAVRPILHVPSSSTPATGLVNLYQITADRGRNEAPGWPRHRSLSGWANESRRLKMRVTDARLIRLRDSCQARGLGHVGIDAVGAVLTVVSFPIGLHYGSKRSTKRCLCRRSSNACDAAAGRTAEN